MSADARPAWSRTERVLLTAAVITLVWALVATSWQCDDAYITFRTVRNFWEGHGLTWNPGERVQVYTHPLWMMVALVAYGVFGEVYWSMSFAAFALALVTAIGLASLHAREARHAALVLAVLAASSAFVQYSVSGLENPLTALAILASVRAAAVVEPDRRALYSTLALSAAFLCRSDAVLLVGPLWLVSVAPRPRALRAIALRAIALGGAPAIAWELFSVVYYGSLVPNTALAKLRLEVPFAGLLARGLAYFSDSLAEDPITLPVAFAGAVYALRFGTNRGRALGLGVLLYFVYLLRIGGDFMSGRFFFAPVFAALAALAHLRPAAVAPAPVPRPWLPFALVMAYAVLWPGSPVRAGPEDGVGLGMDVTIRNTGIADERAFYYPATGALRLLVHPELRADGAPTPPGSLSRLGLRLAAAPRAVVVGDQVGLVGYFGGHVEILDRWAVADPLLARVPFRAPMGWRVGHYPRPIPEGYKASRLAREDRFADPALGAAWEDIVLVTRGPLFESARWAAMFRLWRGVHDEAFERAALH